MKWLATGMIAALCACAAGPQAVTSADMTYWENGVTASEAVFVGASNDSETTAFRYREGGLWDEVAVPGGETRFTFAETGRDVSAIRLTDASRNGGLSLILDLDRKVVDLQEAPGEPWYVRYTIVAVH